jgi:hypothetical protein
MAQILNAPYFSLSVYYKADCGKCKRKSLPQRANFTETDGIQSKINQRLKNIEWILAIFSGNGLLFPKRQCTIKEHSEYTP